MARERQDENAKCFTEHERPQIAGRDRPCKFLSNDGSGHNPPNLPRNLPQPTSIELVVSLLHVAVRNPGVHEFLPVSLVSQTRIELQCMRLRIQEEIVDVF